MKKYPNYLRLPLEFVNQLNIYEWVVYSYLLMDIMEVDEFRQYQINEIADNIGLTRYLVKESIHKLELKGFLTSKQKTHKLFKIARFPEKWEFEFIPYKAMERKERSK